MINQNEDKLKSNGENFEQVGGGIELLQIVIKSKQDAQNSEKESIDEIKNESDIGNNSASSSPERTEVLGSFDWSTEEQDDNNDDFIIKKRTCCLDCCDWYRRWPILLRTILYCLFGNVIFMCPGVISFLFFLQDKAVSLQDMKATNGFSIGGYPIFVWSVYFCIVWTAWFGFRWALSVIPEIILRLVDCVLGTTTDLLTGMQLRSSTVEHIVDYIRFLKGYICLVLRAYLDRMNQTREAMSVLEHLNRARKILKDSSPSKKITTKVIKENKMLKPVSKGARVAGRVAARAAQKFGRNVLGGFSSVLSVAVGIDGGLLFGGGTSGIVLRSANDAKTLARTLFEALVSHKKSDSMLDPNVIYQMDFFRWFESPDDAKRAFSVFDVDENGDITRQEMKNAIFHIWKEKKSLESSLRDTDQAIQKLDDILKVFEFGMQIDTKSFLTAAISVWAGVLFAVGGTVKNLLESIIFLFITHPYDVGDRVNIDSTKFVVKEFGMLTTVLKALDGREFYGPNMLLAGKFIQNVRRSGPQSEDITVSVAASTAFSKISALQDRLRKFLGTEEMRREFSNPESLNVSIQEI
ncbi:hypothetical protein HK096_005614, partial [Nowakowskiella sp. JEL0078]